MGEADLGRLLCEFEAQTLPKAEWAHAAHLRTGACYVHRLGEAAATAEMRERVKAYNLAVGGQNTATSGYHETLTVFWIKLLAELRRENQAITREDFARLAVDRFEARRTIFEQYYAFEVVASRASATGLGGADAAGTHVAGPYTGVHEREG